MKFNLNRNIFNVLVLVMSFCVLMGWFFKLNPLLQIIPGRAPMQFNTALLLFICSLAACLQSFKLYRYSNALFSSCLVFSTLTLSQYIFAFNLGIDEFFWTSHLFDETSHPGRMAPSTAISFILLTLSYLSRIFHSENQFFKLLRWFLIFVILSIAFTSFISLILNFEPLYIWQKYTRMAVHTAGAFIFLTSNFFIRFKNEKLNSQARPATATIFSFIYFTIFIILANNVLKTEQEANARLRDEYFNRILGRLETNINLRVEALERLAIRVKEKSYSQQSRVELDAKQYIIDFKDIASIGLIQGDKYLWVVPRQYLDQKESRDHTRQLAYESAIRSGKSALTTSVELYEDGLGFIVYSPLDATSNARVLKSVFRLNDVMSRILRSSELQRLSLSFRFNSKEYFWGMKEHYRDILEKDFQYRGLSLKLFASFENYGDEYINSAELTLLVGLVSAFVVFFISILFQIATNSRREAIEASRIKSSFLANMSHEIRTPLNGILGMSRILSDSDVPESVRERVKIINRSGEQLLDIINDLLDFSKMESGKFKLDIHSMAIEQVVDNSISLFKQSALTKGLDITLDYDNQLPDWVLGDSLRLSQILNNLVSNAIKFTSKGMIEVIVRKEQGNFVEFKVKDSGIGMSQETQAKLFKVFSQGDSSTTRHYGGSGLGLSISKNLVEMMNGSLTVKSEPGQGSEFTFILPLPKSIEPIIKSEPQIRPVRQKSLNILIVDDVEVNRIIAKEFLRRLGHISDEAESGLVAIEKIKVNSYDAVLMDCHMPEMDGFEATALIKKMDPKRVPFIIALTASAMEEDVKKCFAAGMDDFLSKPVNFKDLANRLQLLSDGMTESLSQTPPEIDKINQLAADTGIDPKDIIKPVLDSIQELMPQIEQAFHDEDFSNLAFYTHTLKGVLLNVATHEQIENLIALEKLAKNHDRASISRIFKEMHSEVSSLTDLYQSLLS